MRRRIVIASPNLSFDRTIGVEAIEIGHVHRSTRSDARGGGKGINVARALKCVGVDATVVGLTAGRTGEAVTALLHDEGIETVAVWLVGETRSCLTVLSDDDVTVFNESGPLLPSEAWDEFEDRVVRQLGEETLFVCSGSFPPRAPDDAARRLLEAARRRGCPTICDTSRAQLGRALAARPDVVVPNLAEARTTLYGSHSEPVEAGPDAIELGAEAARALVERGALAAIVTLGAAGAVSCSGGRTTTWAPLQVDALNPVGAGDCFVAGLAWGMSTGHHLHTCMRRGLAMAAASCETFAAGVLERDRYEELLGASG